MGLTSAINTSFGAPLKCDPFSLRISPPPHALKWARPQFSHHHLSSSLSVSHRRFGRDYSITYARGTEQEDGLSTSEAEKSSSLTHDDIDKVNDCQAPSPPEGELKEKSEGLENYTTSLKTVAACVSTAVAFGIGIGLKDGVGKASEYFAGYLLEQSLSVDNLFVFVLIFKYFKVPLMYQNRVLSYGIAGAIVFRSSFILLGTATLQRFEAVNLLLATILLYSSFKLFASDEDDTDLKDNFIVKTCQRFIPVTSDYDGNKFITNQNGVWKASTILGRPHLYYSQ